MIFLKGVAKDVGPRVCVKTLVICVCVPTRNYVVAWEDHSDMPISFMHTQDTQASIARCMICGASVECKVLQSHVVLTEL